MSILWEDQFLIWSLPLMSHLTNSTLLCRQLSKMCYTRKWGEWKMLEKMRRYSSCHYDLLNSQAHVFLLFVFSSLADNTTRPIPYNAALFPANELSRAQLWHKCSLCCISGNPWTTSQCSCVFERRSCTATTSHQRNSESRRGSLQLQGSKPSRRYH